MSRLDETPADPTHSRDSPPSRPRDASEPFLRSSSPAIKRPASDMGAQEREDYTSDIEMEKSSNPGETSGSALELTPKAKQQDTGSRHEAAAELTEIPARHANVKSFLPGSSEDTCSTVSDNTMATSSTSTAATSIVPTIAPTDLPSIDEQVSRVTALAQKPLEDKQKGYAVSMRWLNRVRARSSMRSEIGKVEKSATEGEIGPVDNTDLTVPMDGLGALEDEMGAPYIPFKAGLQLDEDYVLLPSEAWDAITQWYGILANSPVIIRYVRNTSTGDVENLQYELNPPIFSLLKLPAEQAITPQTLKEKDLPPSKLLASRHMPFNTWLSKAKRMVGVDMNTRVRVWKVLGGLPSSSGSGSATPGTSRSASPAPGANIVASAGSRMVLDPNTFANLEKGADRELVDAKDQTMNPNYNGHSSILLAGLSRDEVVVLEEQMGGPAGGEWVSEGVKTQMTRLGLPKNGAAAEKALAKAAASGGRASPAAVGMVTRERQRQEGKPRGITGLGNLGNTCYMNSALQCIRSVEELTVYFLSDRYKQDLNSTNPLGYGGEVARAYANLLAQIFSTSSSGTFSPTHFKRVIARYAPSFSGYGQQDSQEFLLFLLDGLQEDLNRIKNKPYIEKPDSTDEMVENPTALKELADESWKIYKARNDSVISDLFAGMYKSTVICPVCSKVSIIFDPFTNLTLQLPVENTWTKQIFYFPLHGPPVKVDVDIDKHATFAALKDYVAQRTGADSAKLISAEIYKQKFYKMFENPTTIAEHNIQAGDQVGLYEVEDLPTNYDPQKARRPGPLTFTGSTKMDIPDTSSPRADQILVPLFHRLGRVGNGRRASFFGPPSYIILTRHDAKSIDEILRKVLSNVANMTTMPILELDESTVNTSTTEEPDTVVMNDDDNNSSDSRVKAESVQGEEGLVDVSMRDVSEPNGYEPTRSLSTKVIPPILRRGSFIPAQLQNLFDMRIYGGDDEAIPLGWNSLDEGKELIGISERLLRVQRRRNKYESGSESNSSEGEGVVAQARDDSDEQSDSRGSGSESDVDLPSTRRIFTQPRRVPQQTSKARTYSERRKRRATGHAKKPPPNGEDDDDEAWLVRPGEAVVLDWNNEAYDALFGGSGATEGEMRGMATLNKIETLPDAELAAKRSRRQARKKNGVTLDECLDEFGKMETLSENNSWYCPRCKDHRQADKKFELWKVPDILVMHLKRFSSNRNFRDKLELHVEYPVEGLDLSQRVIMNEEDKSMVYDLIAVDNHYGGLGGGHYTALAQNFFNQEWYDYNDSHVSSRNARSTIVTPNAYLLFYRRRSESPLGGSLLSDIVTASRSRGTAANLIADSRDASPAEPGEGLLGGSSLTGSSSGYHSAEAGVNRHMGGGGLAAQQHQQIRPGASLGTGSRALKGQHWRKAADGLMEDNDDKEDGRRVPPLRSDNFIPDEGIDIPDDGDGDDDEDDNDVAPYDVPPELAPAWSFSHLGSAGAPHSRMTTTAPPPSSLNGEAGSGSNNNDFYTHEEDLFATTTGAMDEDDDNDNASTQAEGGDDDRSSVELSDRARDFIDDDDDLPMLGESSPPMAGVLDYDMGSLRANASSPSALLMLDPSGHGGKQRDADVDEAAEIRVDETIEVDNDGRNSRTSEAK